MHKYGDKGHNGREKSGWSRFGGVGGERLQQPLSGNRQGLAGSGSVTKPILVSPALEASASVSATAL